MMKCLQPEMGVSNEEIMVEMRTNQVKVDANRKEEKEDIKTN
jgi:HSP20 family molecular chaperone IbpA